MDENPQTILYNYNFDKRRFAERLFFFGLEAIMCCAVTGLCLWIAARGYLSIFHVLACIFVCNTMWKMLPQSWRGVRSARHMLIESTAEYNKLSGGELSFAPITEGQLSQSAQPGQLTKLS